MLQGEHSAILYTFIKLPFSIKTIVLSNFKWPLKTGFTVYHLFIHALLSEDLKIVTAGVGFPISCLTPMPIDSFS